MGIYYKEFLAACSPEINNLNEWVMFKVPLKIRWDSWFV